MNKKLLTVLVAILLVVTMSVCLFACSDAESTSTKKASFSVKDSDTSKIVTKSIQINEKSSSEQVKIVNQLSIQPDLIVKTSQNVIMNVLTKLLENAAKFTTNGNITLTTTLADGQLHFAVSDTGPGIPVDKHEYVFKRFAKLDSFSQGAGLGLTVARLQAEHLDGTVTLDANYHDGAKFDFIIPIT